MTDETRTETAVAAPEWYQQLVDSLSRIGVSTVNEDGTYRYPDEILRDCASAIYTDSENEEMIVYDVR